MASTAHRKMNSTSSGMTWPIWQPLRPTLLLLCICLAAQLVLSSCSNSAHSAARATATPQVQLATTPRSLPLPALPLASAWGNVPITHLGTDMGDNRVFIFEIAATPDGQWLVGGVEPRDFIANTLRRLSYLALYNVRTRQVARIRALLQPQSQVLGVSIDDHWLAWSEATDQPTFFDWTMFLYNRDTGQVAELASAPRDATGHAAPGPNTPRVVSKGYVIWSQPLAPITQGNDASLKNAVVRLKDLATGQITTLATRAGQSTLAWPWAAWGQITSGTGRYITLKNMLTGQELRLQQQPVTVVLCGPSLAYDDTSGVYVNDDFSTNTGSGVVNPGVSIAAPRNVAEHLEFVTLNNRLVAWSQQIEQPPIWDRLLQRSVLLPTTNGRSDSWVGGRTLVWFEPEPQAQMTQDERNGLTPLETLNVIDTTTLPTAPRT